MKFREVFVKTIMDGLIGAVPDQPIDAYKKLFDMAYYIGYKEGRGDWDGVSMKEFKRIFCDEK